MVAELMNESSSNIAKMDSIGKNASAELKEELKKGNLGITAVYEAAKLPLEKQREIAKKSAKRRNVSIKEITRKKELQDQKKGKERNVKEELADTYARLVEEWLKNNTGEITKAAETAIQKVFKTNIPQTGWTDIEWVVFTAGAIMQRADCVRTEDLCLMKEILMRCR